MFVYWLPSFRIGHIVHQCRALLVGMGRLARCCGNLPLSASNIAPIKSPIVRPYQYHGLALIASSPALTPSVSVVLASYLLTFPCTLSVVVVVSPVTACDQPAPVGVVSIDCCVCPAVPLFFHSCGVAAPMTDDVVIPATQQSEPKLFASASGGDSIEHDSSTADAWAEFDAEVALVPLPAPRSRQQPFSSSAVLSSRCSILDLPDELFFHISDYLSTVSLLRLVCRPPSSTFRRVLLLHSAFDLDADRGVEGTLATTRSLHQQKELYAPLISLASQFRHLSHLTLDSFGPQLTDSLLQPLLAQHGPSLLSLSLSANSLICPHITAPNLLSLDLSRCRTLQSPLLHCPQLSELDLSRTYINDLDLVRGCEGVQLLRVLRLQSCKNIRSLSLQLRHLRILDVSNTAVTDEAVERIAQLAPALSVLFVSECSSIRSPRVNSSTLTVLSLRSCDQLRSPSLLCPSLSELDLSNTALSDSALVAALSTVPSLQRLSLRQTYELSSPVLGFDLLQLLSLDLTGSSVQTEGVQSFLNHTPALQSLQVQQCLKVMEGLMTAASVPACLPDLCDVNLRSTGVTDDDVNTLLHICPALSRLNVSMCVTLSSLTTVADSLLHVDLSFSAVNDSSLALLLSSTMPHLASAVFDHCNSLSHPQLHHSTLQQLHLAHCRSMDSLSLDCLALVSLNLSGCTSLSTTALTPSTLSSLRVLEVRNTSQYAVNGLMEQLGTKQVEVRTQANGFIDTAYRPGRTRQSITESAVENEANGVPNNPPRGVVTPQSASRRVSRHARSPSSFGGTSTSPVSAQPSPSTTSTDLSPSPHASPSSLSSACTLTPSQQPNHNLRTPPRPIARPIVRRDVRDDEMNHSPSSHGQSASPVKSRYLSFVNHSPKQSKSHRSVASASSTTALTFSATGLHSPVTPPSSRYSRTMLTVSSTPVTPEPDNSGNDLPPSPALSSSSYTSGVVVPALSAAITRSLSAMSLQSAGNGGCSTAPPSPRAAVPYPFPSLAHLPTASQLPDASLSTLLQSRPIPRSTLLSTSPVPPAPILSQLPLPGRFDSRSSSLSGLECMPRYVLNSVEVYIIQQHIAEIEQRLQAHDDSTRQLNGSSGKGGRLGRQQPAVSVSTVVSDSVLSAAVRYGLKRQLALLKARLKKEERLVEELVRQYGETTAVPPTATVAGTRARQNST